MTDFNDIVKKLASGTYPDITTMALPPLNQALPPMPQTDFPLPQNPGYYSREAFDLAGLPANVTTVPAMPSMVAAPLPGTGGGGGGTVGDALGIDPFMGGYLDPTIPMGSFSGSTVPTGPSTDLVNSSGDVLQTVGDLTGQSTTTPAGTIGRAIGSNLLNQLLPGAGNLIPTPDLPAYNSPVGEAINSPINLVDVPDPSALGAELSGTGMDYGDTYQNLFQTPGGPWDFSSIDPAEEYFLHNLMGIGDSSPIGTLV